MTSSYQSQASASVVTESNAYDRWMQSVGIPIHRGYFVQDLRTMEQVDLQEAVSMNMTVTNNMDLADAIERTVTVVRPLMVVGLAIQAALANQKRAIEAVKATQDYAGQLLVANAEAIEKQTQEIGDLTQNASVALTKVEEAYHKVLSAIDKADEIRRRGSAAAENAASGSRTWSRSWSVVRSSSRPARPRSGASVCRYPATSRPFTAPTPAVSACRCRSSRRG